MNKQTLSGGEMSFACEIWSICSKGDLNLFKLFTSIKGMNLGASPEPLIPQQAAGNQIQRD
jgi:hypothetical protein